MSAPRTPTKSGGSKGDEARLSRASGGVPGTPPTGSAQRRSAGSSQIGSPTVRSGAASAASMSGAREKVGSATNKQTAATAAAAAAASPVPGQ